MIKVNLLPYREKEKKENFVQQIFIIAGSFIFFILVLVLLQVRTNSSISNLEIQKKEAESSLADLDKKIGSLEKYKNEKKRSGTEIRGNCNFRRKPFSTSEDFGQSVHACSGKRYLACQDNPKGKQS